MMMDSHVTEQMWIEVMTEKGTLIDPQITSSIYLKDLNPQLGSDKRIGKIYLLEAMFFANKLSEREVCCPGSIVTKCGIV